MDVLIRFLNIVEASEKKLEATSNFPDVVPYGIELLNIISDNIDLRPEFGKLFIQTISKSTLSHEPLVEFCMHSLRWVELKEEFGSLCDNAVKNSRWSEIQRLQGALAAFEDDWEDAIDFYGEYFNAKNT